MASLKSIDNKEEWVDAVAKLIEMTQKKEIIWHSVELSEVPHMQRLQEVVLDAFKANHLGQNLLLSRHSFSAPTSGRNIRIVMVILRFVDADGVSVYKVPDVEAVDHLLEEARLQSSNIRDYLDKLLRP